MSLREIQEQQQKEAAERLVRQQVVQEMAAEQAAQSPQEMEPQRQTAWGRTAGTPSLKQIMQEEAAKENDDRQRGDEKKKKKPEPVKKKEVPAAPVFQPPNTVWGSKSSATVSLQQIQMEQTQKKANGTVGTPSSREARDHPNGKFGEEDFPSKAVAGKSPGKVLSMREIQEEERKKEMQRREAQAREQAEAKAKAQQASNAADDGLFWSYDEPKEEPRSGSTASAPNTPSSALNTSEFPSLGGSSSEKKKDTKKKKKGDKGEETAAAQVVVDEQKATQEKHQQELIDWAKGKLKKIKKKNVDDSILISALVAVNSADEVRSYVAEYLGTGAPANAFADEFISLKSFGLGDQFEGGTGGGGGVGGLQTQKKKKKGKAANNLLNFSVAPPTGEIETI
jgi:hypothetical protein